MMCNKSMFIVSFDMGLSQMFSGCGYEVLICFIYWLVEIQCLVEWELIVVVCDLIYGMDYEFWLYEILFSLKVVEMCMKNVN